MATISAMGVGVRHAITRALATANLSAPEATFKVLSANVELHGRSRIVRAEATLAILSPRPIGDWPADKLLGLVNPDGEHPLMVRISAERPFFLDIMPVSWERWLRTQDDTLPPGLDMACPRTDLNWERATDFARRCGKRLPTEDELRAAWGPLRFPWGDTADPRLGRASPPRYDDLPELGDHPPLPNGVFDLGAWLWQWTAQGTLSGGRADGDPGHGMRPDDALRPVGLRLAQDG